MICKQPGLCCTPGNSILSIFLWFILKITEIFDHDAFQFSTRRRKKFSLGLLQTFFLEQYLLPTGDLSYSQPRDLVCPQLNLLLENTLISRYTSFTLLAQQFKQNWRKANLSIYLCLSASLSISVHIYLQLGVSLRICPHTLQLKYYPLLWMKSTKISSPHSILSYKKGCVVKGP